MRHIQVKSAALVLRLCKRINFQCAFCHQNLGKANGESFYDILGVRKNASDKHIKMAYMLLREKMHPDVETDNKSQQDKISRISNAYKVLCNATTRNIYDDKLKDGVKLDAEVVPAALDWNPKKPKYYYPPEFYKDPKLRKEAEAAWEKDRNKVPDDMTEEERYDEEVLLPMYRRNFQFSLFMSIVLSVILIWYSISTFRLQREFKQREARKIESDR